MFTFTLVDLEH